jgi:hypothetical protein
MAKGSIKLLLLMVRKRICVPYQSGAPEKTEPLQPRMWFEVAEDVFREEREEDDVEMSKRAGMCV